MIHIRKGTWHYHVWRFTYYFSNIKLGGDNAPEQTNLCRYVSRMILMPIPISISFGLLVAFCIICVVVGNALTILSGTGLCFIGSEEEGMKYFPPVAFGARQIPMPAVVLSSYGLLLVAVIAYFHPWTTLTYAGYGAGGLGALALFYVIGAVIVDGFRHADGWLLFKQYLKAKKQGVCPFVTFDGPDHPAPAEVGKSRTA